MQPTRIHIRPRAAAARRAPPRPLVAGATTTTTTTTTTRAADAAIIIAGSDDPSSVDREGSQKDDHERPPHPNAVPVDGSAPAAAAAAAAPDAAVPRAVKGILRVRPKYSSSPAPQSPLLPSASIAEGRASPLYNDRPSGEDQAGGYLDSAPVSADTLVIVERTRTRRSRKSSTSGRQHSAMSNPPPSGVPTSDQEDSVLQGRAPSTLQPSTVASEVASVVPPAAFSNGGDGGLQQPHDEDPDPLVFSSLYELMEHAGTLPNEPKPQHSTEEEIRTKGTAESPTNDTSHDAAAAAAASLISPGSVVEADLEFRCMDPDTWEMVRQEQQEQELAGIREDSDDEDGGPPRRSWLASMPAQGRGMDENHGDDDDLQEGEEDDDDEYFDFLRSLKEDRNNNPDYYSSDDDISDDEAHGGDSDSDDDDNGSERNHRMLETARKPPDRPPSTTTATPFLVLWRALCQWVTPQAARYLRAAPCPGDVRPFEPVLNAESDVVASRLGGLYSQLQMHVSSSLLALRFADNPRLAWIRLGDLLRCFSYARPMPNLDRHHIRALATILLHSVLRNQEGFQGDDGSVLSSAPQSCAEVGLSLAEYLHLTKVLGNLGPDHDEEERVAILTTGPATVARPKNGFHK
jgi:hypothetical protein